MNLEMLSFSFVQLWVEVGPKLWWWEEKIQNFNVCLGKSRFSSFSWAVLDKRPPENWNIFFGNKMLQGLFSCLKVFWSSDDPSQFEVLTHHTSWVKNLHKLVDIKDSGSDYVCSKRSIGFCFVLSFISPGVPQGSILGLHFFYLHVSFGSNFLKHNISFPFFCWHYVIIYSKFQ